MTFIKLHSSSYTGDDKLSEGAGRLGSHATDASRPTQYRKRNENILLLLQQMHM